MKVILAIDGSRHSHAALVEFARQPWPNGTEVQILTAIHARHDRRSLIGTTRSFAGSHAHVIVTRRRRRPGCRERRLAR